MNPWKIAFWCCLVALVAGALFSAYAILDQGVTLTYQTEGFTATESDLDALIALINQTNLSKEEIEKALSGHRFYEFMDFRSDTVSLERVTLIFREGRLARVEKEW